MSKANGVDGKRYVSRSVWAKLKEENKRLKRDLKILCKNDVPITEYVIVRTKWRKEFEKDDAFYDLLREASIIAYNEKKRLTQTEDEKRNE